MVVLSRQKTPAQIAARKQADQALFAAYPDTYVAFVDTWTGDTLDRAVVVTADTPGEFHRLLATLAPDIRGRVEMTHAPNPDVIELPFRLD